MDTAFAVGQKGVFVGYAQLEDGQEEIFKKGDAIEIVELTADIEVSGFKIRSADKKRLDNAFPDEVKITPAKGAAKATPAAAVVAKPATKGKATAAAPATAPKVAAPAKPAKAAAATAPVLAGAKGKGKAAPVVKQPAPVVEAPVVTITETPALTEIMARSDDMLATAVELQGDIELSFFNLGGLLAVIHYQGLYKSRYPEKGGFEEFVTKELNLHPRKARYLMKIYTTTTSAGYDAERLAALGWTKARVLLSHVEHPKFDINKALAYAEKHKRDDLEAWSKKTYVKATKDGTAASGTTGTTAGSEVVAKASYKFTAHGGSVDIINSAIEQAKTITNSDDLSVAMTQIVTDWASLTNGVETTIEMELARISTKFGVEVAVVETEEAEVEPEPAPAKAKARGGKKK